MTDPLRGPTGLGPRPPQAPPAQAPAPREPAPPAPPRRPSHQAAGPVAPAAAALPPHAGLDAWAQGGDRPLWVAPPVWEAAYALEVGPAPAPLDGPEAHAYQQLLGYDQAENPLSPQDTLALARLAASHQAGLLTQELHLPVDGGQRTLTLRLEAGVDPDQAAAVVAAMYEASHPEHRQAISEVRFHTGHSAMDEVFEQLLQGSEALEGDMVSEMTGGGGVISFFNVGQPKHPLRQDFWDHELAHVMMEAHPSAAIPMVPQGWAEAIEADRPLGHEAELGSYATANLKEDFAESYRLLVTAMREGRLEAFLARHPHRGAILLALFEEG